MKGKGDKIPDPQFWEITNKFLGKKYGNSL